MEITPKNYIIKLQSSPHIQLHFYQLKKRTPIGCQAIYTSKNFRSAALDVNKQFDDNNLIDKAVNETLKLKAKMNVNGSTFKKQSVQDQQIRYFEVLMFSKSMLQINSMSTHFRQNLAHFKMLNSKIVSRVIQKIETTETIFIISQASEYTLKSLVERRLGLTVFESLFYFLNIYEIISYMRSRDCYLQKIDLETLYLDKNMKIMLGFNIFFNTLQKRPFIKYLPFRKEKENRNICPEILNQKMRTIDYINSWNLGVFLYQILLNSKPFPSEIYAQKQKISSNLSNIANKMIQNMISSLLMKQQSKRLKFQLIFGHPLIKQYKNIPNMLPITILSCPPSENYHIQYEKIGRDAQKEVLEQNKSSNQMKESTNLRYSVDRKSNSGSQSRSHQKGEKKNLTMVRMSIETDQHQNLDIISKTQKYIKKTDRNLSQTKVYVQQFIDISHCFGFGYQMNTGTIGFVYNDETQLYFPSTSGKDLIYCNENRQLIKYNYDKLPEEEDLKKKLYILQAYIKSIKKYKPKIKEKNDLSSRDLNQFNNVLEEKLTTVRQFAKTKNASIFHLSNDNIQIVFPDKICFLITRNNVYFQWKNSDKLEKYESSHDENPEYEMRKRYSFQMVKKIFDRNLDFLDSRNQTIQKKQSTPKNAGKQSPKKFNGTTNKDIVSSRDIKFTRTASKKILA